jgi:hypothetical protein
MPTPVSSITRAATRKAGEPLNILTAPTHERYETGLAKTGHNFYAWRVLDGSIKDWDENYAPLPKNYTLLNPQKGANQIPMWLDFDLILSQNKFGQFPVLQGLAQQLQVPFISLEHTLPLPAWTPGYINALHQMRGDMNVFISEFSRKGWGWGEDEAEVIHHGVDTDLFRPTSDIDKKPHILSVVNDWIKRDVFCGFRLWRDVTNGLLVYVLGNTPGLSMPAKDTKELVSHYNAAQIFLNTSLVSPVPTALLEAMSCGCAVVSTATCMIPEVIQNGVNGYISNDPAQLRRYLDMLLANPERCKALGAEARKTIVERFGMEKFVERWNDLFLRALKT